MLSAPVSYAVRVFVEFSAARRGAEPDTATPDTWAEKVESLERINSIRETNENFDWRNSCKRLVPSRLHERAVYENFDWRNSCKRLVPSRLHELRQSKFSFVSRIEFISSKLSTFSAHVSGGQWRSSRAPHCSSPSRFRVCPVRHLGQLTRLATQCRLSRLELGILMCRFARSRPIVAWLSERIRETREFVDLSGDEIHNSTHSHTAGSRYMYV